jgi:hypothetical protein
MGEECCPKGNGKRMVDMESRKGAREGGRDEGGESRREKKSNVLICESRKVATITESRPCITDYLN